MDRTITVWGKPHSVQMAQKSRTSWVASGPYLGEMLHGRGESASSALARWAALAKAKAPPARRA